MDGHVATRRRIGDPVAFARDLAGVLVALQSVDPRVGRQQIRGCARFRHLQRG
jgi:hypothetical protein